MNTTITITIIIIRQFLIDRTVYNLIRLVENSVNQSIQRIAQYYEVQFPIKNKLYSLCQ